MRTESRFEQYDLNITLPSPLIDRCDRFTLTERISARGRVLVAPDPAEIQALVDIIGHRQYESVAIGFLQSRSEEHTSELQSLMRISYAVFCMTTKISTNN